MIVQANEPVTFSSTSRIVLPLESPTLAGSILVLAVVMDGRTPGLRISDDLGMPRWRQANCDGRRALPGYAVSSNTPQA